MKWQNDPFISEKYKMLDTIVEFSQTEEGKEFSKLTIATVEDFIDRYFELNGNSNE